LFELFGDLLDELNDQASKSLVSDFDKRRNESKALFPCHKVGYAGGQIGFRPIPEIIWHSRHAFEEKGHRDFQKIGGLLELAGAYPVGAFFVFLNLLKGNSESIRKVGLRIAEHQAPHADARSDMTVDRVNRVT